MSAVSVLRKVFFRSQEFIRQQRAVQDVFRPDRCFFIRFDQDGAFQCLLPFFIGFLDRDVFQLHQQDRFPLLRRRTDLAQAVRGGQCRPAQKEEDHPAVPHMHRDIPRPVAAGRDAFVVPEAVSPVVDRPYRIDDRGRIPVAVADEDVWLCSLVGFEKLRHGVSSPSGRSARRMPLSMSSCASSARLWGMLRVSRFGSLSSSERSAGS